MSDTLDAHRDPPPPGDDGRGGGLVGRRLGPYEILEEVGHGGMSVVYRGRDTRLDREVAVKVLHPFLADREDARRRFEREARAVAKLHHPNILEIYDFSDEGTEQSYIVMELVQGETLRQFAERVTIDPPEMAALLGTRICAALERAHALGIVHRDVKPENVMLDRSGAVKLMDFGIAHMRDASSLTLTGTLLGSPAHMAPEAIDGATIDERADQFSLGTILYWLATGKLPFTGKNPHALLKKISEGRFTPAQRVNPKISDRLAEVINRTLECKPEARFPTIGDLRDALCGVLREGDIDDGDQTLLRFYCDPQPTRVVLTRTVVEAFTRRARELQRQGETALALAAMSRVLALEPDNRAAREELEALTRRIRFSALRRRIARGAGIAVAGLGLVALIAGLALRMLGASPHETPAEPPAPAVDPAAAAAPVAAPTPPAVEASPVSGVVAEGAAAPPPGATAEQVPATAPPEWTLPRDRVVRRQPPRRQSVPPRGRGAAGERTPTGHGARAGDADTSAWREITVRVDPWADIFVDDELRVRGSKIATLRLAPGRHELRFENRYAAPVIQEVEVPLEGAVPSLAVKLVAMKPAYLMVQVTPDAEINVNGTYKGPASASLDNPVVIAMPDRMASATRRVELSREGYQTQVIEQRFVPGETVRMSARLQPEPPADAVDATSAGAGEVEPAPPTAP